MAPTLCSLIGNRWYASLSDGSDGTGRTRREVYQKHKPTKTDKRALTFAIDLPARPHEGLVLYAGIHHIECHLLGKKAFPLLGAFGKYYWWSVWIRSSDCPRVLQVLSYVRQLSNCSANQEHAANVACPVLYNNRTISTVYSVSSPSHEKKCQHMPEAPTTNSNTFVRSVSENKIFTE